MANASSASRLGERLLGNRYAHENLSDAVTSIREARARASKRRLSAASDRKLHEQISRAAASLAEAARALRTGREKPQSRHGRRLLLIVGVGALGGGVALAVSERLRNAIFGQDEERAPEPPPPPPPPGQPAPEPAPTSATAAA